MRRQRTFDRALRIGKTVTSAQCQAASVYRFRSAVGKLALALERAHEIVLAPHEVLAAFACQSDPFQIVLYRVGAVQSVLQQFVL